MDFINLLGSSIYWPEGDFWTSLIRIFDFIGNYAWIIIVFTIVLKLILSPLDFTQRFYMNKTTRAQAKIAPELEKLKRQYGQNQNLLYQKQNELYQKNNINNRGSCVFMIVYLVLTLVIFMTLFNSMQFIARENIKNQYNTLQTEYTQVFNEEYVRDYLGVDITGNEAHIYTQAELEPYESLKPEVERAEHKAQAVSDAQDIVYEKYDEVKVSWLWIKNIWVADKPTQKAVLSYDSYIAVTQDKAQDKVLYESVMAKLSQEGSSYNTENGYYILSIIVLLVSLLSQFITRKMSQPKSKDGTAVQTPNPMSSKVMMFVMPLIMVIFTLNSSSIFSLYLIANTLVATLLTPVIMVICNRIEEKNEKKKYEQTKVDYRR